MVGLSKLHVGYGRAIDPRAGVKGSRCRHSDDSRYDLIFRYVSALQELLPRSILIGAFDSFRNIPAENHVHRCPST